MKRQHSEIVSSAVLVAIVAAGFNLFAISAPTLAQDTLYKSCEEYKLTEPITLGDSTSSTEATAETTDTAAVATEVPSTGATTTEDNIAFLSVVADESEACYVASETFLENNMLGLPSGFNGAVGVTKTISGDIALDLNNVANSQIGDITINISEFKSDSDRRDGFIRQNFLESNTYPYATLTNATAIGLPTGPYEEGTELKFQIEGTLKVHDTERDTTFDATGSYRDGTLVVTAVTDLNMSDFGITVPEIGGLLKVDDATRLVVNLVARVSDAEATETPSS